MQNKENSYENKKSIQNNDSSVKLNVSQKLRNYIKDNGISADNISSYTGISSEKILDDNKNFSASEFLEICSFLNLKPEEI